MFITVASRAGQRAVRMAQGWWHAWWVSSAHHTGLESLTEEI